jgi:hypothetical protein
MKRMNLSEMEQIQYSNLLKGFEGELSFDKLLEENIQGERYIMNDLLFEVNNSFFQIDTLVISQGMIHLFDIKNYMGDYYIKSDLLYAKRTN